MFKSNNKPYGPCPSCLQPCVRFSLSSVFLLCVRSLTQPLHAVFLLLSSYDSIGSYRPWLMASLLSLALCQVNHCLQWSQQTIVRSVPSNGARTSDVMTPWSFWQFSATFYCSSLLLFPFSPPRMISGMLKKLAQLNSLGMPRMPLDKSQIALCHC